jgi:tetratricopeptide (TPR) repeat protein
MRKTILLIFFLIAAALQAFSQDEMRKASEAYKAGEYEVAMTILTEFLEKGANPEAFKLRGDCLQKVGDATMALQDYDKARVYGYREDDLFLNRGICKSTIGQLDGAKLDIISYIEKQQDDPKGYYWMAAVEYMNADNKACSRYVDMAIALDSSYSDAYYLKGANLADTGRNLQAMEYFQLSYEMNPKQHRAKLNVAVMLIDMGQFRNALEILSELRLENIDFHGEVLYYRGEAFYLMHDMEGACMEWNEAADLGDPDAAVNHRKLCIDKSGKAKIKRRSYGEF